jgi:hypothetical protein
LEERFAEFDKMFPDDGKLITAFEASILVVLLHAQKITVHLIDGVEYVEGTNRKEKKREKREEGRENREQGRCHGRGKREERKEKGKGREREKRETSFFHFSFFV